MLFMLNTIKPKHGLFGGCFQHAYSSTLWKKPKYFDWDYNTLRETTCFMEDSIVPNIGKHKNIRKWAWVVESSAIIGSTVNEIIKHAKEISENYEFLISHDRRLYDLAPNFHYLPPHGYWIEKPDFYPKEKLVSLISSSKRMCSGHDYRLEWVQKLMGKVDVFGRGLNDFSKKEDALCDYMFSVTIENSSYETYWTEKVLDCFATGTIPIYHGAPDLGNYFNMDGVIILNEKFDIDRLSPELYLSKMDAIRDNFSRCLKFDVIEDIIWERFLNS